MNSVKKLLVITIFGFTSCKVVTNEQKLNCLEKYIASISKLPVYEEVRIGVVDSIASWRLKNLEVKCCKVDSTVLDSAIFFNPDYTRCILLFVDSLDTNESNTWNFVQTIGGEKIGSEWRFYHISFPTFGYSLKANGYKNLGFEYLSRDARLDIINRGFFKRNSCTIDRDFVNSEEWIADWVRKKHERFLNPGN